MFITSFDSLDIYGILSIYLNIDNQAIAVCENLGGMLFTDSVAHHNMLLRKYELSVKNSSKLKWLKDIVPSHSPIDYEKLRSLSFTVFNSFITSEDLANLSFGDILKIRKKFKSQRDMFMAELRMLSSTVQENPWDSGFEKSILKLVDEKILPQTLKIEQDIRNEILNAIGGATKRASEALTPVLLLSVLSGLSLTQILAIGAGAIAGGITIGAREGIKHFMQKKRILNTSAAYLIKVKETAKKSGNKS